MKLDHGNQTIIISNKKIYDFFQKNNIDLNEIEIILERMCNMCEYNKTNKDVHQTEAIFDKMKNEIVKNITLEFEKHNDNKHQKYLTDLQNILESKSSFLSSSIYSFIETKISNSFIGLKKDIKEINHQDVLVTMIQNLQSSQSELSKEL